MNIQWYPGHMAKAKRLLADSLKLVDVVVEMVDARAPGATRNPDFEALFAAKPRVAVLNKADLANPSVTQAWVRALQGEGQSALAFSANAGKGVKEAVALVESAARPLVEHMRSKGVKKTVRAMIVGIPNVGKSTFINRLRGSSAAKAGDKPGVTRGKQWIIIHSHLEFLDTPGLLWPKLSDQQAALHLAYLGSIRAETMDATLLCASLLERLAVLAPAALAGRLKLDSLQGEGLALLEAACVRRGWLLPGARPDVERGAQVILDEFRGGRMGRISLETPKEDSDGQGE